MNRERQIEHPHQRNHFAQFLALAILVHLVLAPAFSSSFGFLKAPDEQSVDVELLPEPEPSPAEAAKAEEAKKEAEKHDTQIPGQVVDIPKPAHEEEPDQARFVSEYNQKVAHETRARPRARTQPRAAAPAPPPSGAPTANPTAAPGGAAGESGPGEGPPPGPGQGAGPNGTLSRKDLTPSDEQLARAIGSGGPQDFVDDADDGDETLLNSKRWRFASFFNRVKRQVADNWHPEVAYRRRDPNGNIYGFRDRITILKVELSPDGRLQNVMLDHPSGVGFLDDEAIAAFNAAQPFPNPPKLLVDEKTGMISFRFGFIFELSSQPSFRVFRYSD